MENKINKKAMVAIIGLSLMVIFALPQNSNAMVSTCTDISVNLKVNSKDAVEIIKLQNFLGNMGYMSIKPTGYFGPVTNSAVKKFQTNEGISSIGIVGPQTRAKIKELSCANTNLDKPLVTAPTEKPVTVVASAQVKLPYSSTDFSDWTTSWGNLSTTTEGVLLVKASENTNGAQTILANSGALTNYKIQANLFVRQATVTLLARYIDDNNFVGCTFSGNYIEILQKVNGVATVVAYTSVTDLPSIQFFYKDMNVSMRVTDNTVGCTILGGEDNVTYTKVDSSLIKGGVGIQTWVNSVGIANIEIKSIKIASI